MLQDACGLVKRGQTVSMVLPLSFKLPDGQWWQFPIEPLISVSGKNIIKRRYVAKSETRGSIKERWSEDDLSINIEGSLINADMHSYPTDDLSTLYEAVRQRQAIEIKNQLLQVLDCHQIVVESYSFPFSKGENVQNFSLNAFSDNSYELFIDVKDV